jgi:23S rRNA pseudouridine2605 synthase
MLRRWKHSKLTNSPKKQPMPRPPAKGTKSVGLRKPRTSSTSKSSFGKAKPSFGKSRPSFGKDKPSFGKDKPAFSKKSSFGKDRPAFGADKPTLRRAKPSFGKDKPSFGKDKPSFGRAKPSFGKDKPSFGRSKPAFGRSKPSFGAGRSDAKPAFRKSTPRVKPDESGPLTLKLSSQETKEIAAPPKRAAAPVTALKLKTATDERPRRVPVGRSTAKPFERKPFERKSPVSRSSDTKTVTLKKKRAPKAAPQKKQAETPGTTRLNKFLAAAGVASRRKADELITAGAVAINGKKVTELGTMVRPHEDRITVNGEIVSLPHKFLYLLLNKPKDTITTTSDERDRSTVLDYVKTEERVYPVGRLDRNTTGVLLLTNDGELTNALTHPSHEIEREYHVTLDKALEADDARKIADGGVNIGEGDITGPAGLALDPKNRKDVILTLREGKNREVRRLFETLGYDVEKLDRIRFASLTHRGMKRGDVRPLTNSEVHTLKRLTGLEE